MREWERWGGESSCLLVEPKILSQGQQGTSTVCLETTACVNFTLRVTHSQTGTGVLAHAL